MQVGVLSPLSARPFSHSRIISFINFFSAGASYNKVPKGLRNIQSKLEYHGDFWRCY
jgi:hypothetical protein